MVAPAILLSLRGVQTVLTIIVLGLTAYRTSPFPCPPPSKHPKSTDNAIVVDTAYPYAPYASLPGSIPFTLFTSIFTLLALAYLVLAPTRLPPSNPLSHKYAIAGIEVLTMSFWFAAFVAVAVRWGSGDFLIGRRWTFWDVGVADAVLSAGLWYVFGSQMGEDINDMGLTWCRVTFVVTTILTLLHVRRSPSKGFGSI
jgi:hypothetical protein